MYGGMTYADAPYADLGSVIIIAACIHVASQLVYNLDVAADSVYQVLASATNVYNMELDTYVC